MNEQPVAIPLHRQDGSVVAVALVDTVDAHHARWRWCLHPTGHAARTEEKRGKKRPLKMHREILGITDPKLHVDHINGSRIDNRRSNLRVVTHAQNQQNRTKLHRDNKSGHRNVNWHAKAGKWAAAVHYQDRKHHLGLFDDVEDAARAVRAFRAANLPFSQEARECQISS